MSGLLPYIPVSNCESVRDKIAVILKDEFENQFMLGNYDSDINQVYVERGDYIDVVEETTCNVCINGVEYSDKNYGGAVRANLTISIDIYARKKTTGQGGPGERGDIRSRLKVTRLLTMARYIFDDPQYKTVAFETKFIETTATQMLGIADPEKYDSSNYMMGQLLIGIRLIESNELLQAVAFEMVDTRQRISTTDNGYQYILP